MEEAAVHRPVLQKAHRAGVAVGHDRLRAVGRAGDVAEARGDLVERLVPRDAREASFALAADPAHRMQHALVGVRALEIARDLGAQDAGGRGMVRRAADGDRAAVLDGRQQRAGIGTIVRAGAAHDAPTRNRGGIERHTVS